MRRGHFETLRPQCPVCRSGAPLSITTGIREHGDDLLEGILTCTNAACLREYPVIDGIPVLVAAIRAWLSANPLQVLQRDDLSPELESLLGDALGPGSAFDTQRYHVGIYAGEQYGSSSVRPPSSSVPRSSSEFLGDRGDEHDPLRGTPRNPRNSEELGPALEIGCATGGATFALAERVGALTIGVDLNFAMLRVASRALREGRVRYARRRVGIVYERENVAFESPARELVDFWCCDAAALPFAEQTFGTTLARNIVDCVASPRDVLAELARTLRRDGLAEITTPYDWSPTATPIEGWLGGHSQRGSQRGASEPVLRALLDAEGLEVVEEEESMPWRVRLHDRSTIEYLVHRVVVRRR